MKKNAVKQNYINERDFSQAIVEHNNRVIAWENLSEEERTKIQKPRISNYIGECFIKLVDNIARKSNFSQYYWIDEGKAHSLELCIRYLHNYNPDATFSLEDCIEKYGQKRGEEKFRVRQTRIKNKDDIKTAGAFSYFTMYVINGFLQVLKREEEERIAKYRQMYELYTEMEYPDEIEIDDGVVISYNMFDNILDYINEYEESLKQKEIEKQNKKLEKILEAKGIEIYFGEEYV